MVALPFVQAEKITKPLISLYSQFPIDCVSQVKVLDPGIPVNFNSTSNPAVAIVATELLAQVR